MDNNLISYISSLIDITKGWYKELFATAYKAEPKKQIITVCQEIPDRGIVTWNSEGMEGGRFHSRKLHVPSKFSGLTIGRGYDMKHKNSGKILNDLTSSGVDINNATIISMAAGKYGDDAEDYISTKGLQNFEISQCVQKKLFDISYLEQESEVKRICGKTDVVKKYGETKWDSLNPAIKDILVDLKFRGDYTGNSRNIIQKFVANNDLVGFAKEIEKLSNWPNVPSDRFKRRKDFIKNAVAKNNNKP